MRSSQRTEGVRDSHSTCGRIELKSARLCRCWFRRWAMTNRAMMKRWAVLLVMVAAGTVVCLAQEGSTSLSQPSASGDGAATKAVAENTGNATITTVGPGFQQRYPRYKLEFG